MDIFTKIREAIAGKKTYILAVVALLTALVSWATSDISTTEFIVAAYAALQTMFLRAGVAKAGT